MCSLVYVDIHDLSSPQEVMVITLAIMAITFGTASHMSPYPPAYYAFLTPCFSIPILIFIFSGDIEYQFVAIACVIFMFYLIFLTKQLHSNLDDIIRYRLSQTELIESIRFEKERAEQAVISKAKFFAAANHDLRQPVHAALLYLESLRLMPHITENVGNLVNKTDAALLNLKELLDGLLDISKIDSTTQLTHKEAIFLPTFIVEWLPSFVDQAKQKGLILKYELDDVYVDADPVVLKRIVMNLLSNAIKFTDSGEITLKGKASGEEILITVADSGVGIPSQKLSLIFDEFVQLSNVERDRSKGLGLGLSICQRLAKQLDSQIMVTSELNRGSCFSFRMPASIEASIDNTRSKPSSFPLSNNEHKNVIVWVLDNEKNIVDAQYQLLTQWNYHDVRALESVLAFKTQLTLEIPDLLICDYRLSNQYTGLDVIDMLMSQAKKLEHKLPKVIMLTGETDSKLLAKLKENNISVLQKPLAPAKLRMAVASLLK